MKKKPIEVVQSADKPVSTKILAESIVKISQSMKQLLNSGLNQRAIEVLVKNDCGVTLVEIGRVINSIKNLEQTYCK